VDNLSEQIIKYVDENDYVTFAKLQNYIQEFTETKGDWSLEKEENLILWNGISEELTDCLVSLIDKEIFLYYPAPSFLYWIDGKMLDYPIASKPKAYKRPHWLPVYLRPKRALEEENIPRDAYILCKSFDIKEIGYE